VNGIGGLIFSTLWSGPSELSSTPVSRERSITAASDSAAGFSQLRSELSARKARKGKKLSFDEVQSVVDDLLFPAIQATRRYQTLQALVNCTRRCLLPDSKDTTQSRQEWTEEIRELEARGIR